MDPLEGASLQAVQEELTNLKLLVIDEKGMIGLKRMAQIDQRLKEIFSDKSEEIFGGRSILLAGDLRQLPPVGDLPLYNTSSKKSAEGVKGRMLYREFDKRTYVLNELMRQRGDDNEPFRIELENLANGLFSVDNWKSWEAQDFDRMSPEAQKSFEDNAILLAAMKKNLISFNKMNLLKLGNPIFKVEAINEPPSGASVDSDQAEGLHQTLFISVGARIIITRNLWTEVKICNGAMGTIRHIVFSSNNTSPLPDLIFVEFDRYEGPTPTYPGLDNVVPIAPVSSSWRSRNTNYTRRQLPVIPAYGVSIHKGQGMTLDKLILDVGNALFDLLNFMSII